MSTKAQIQTLIDTNLADASSITASEHRGVLKDATNNILDNVYANAIYETDATATRTVSNANFDYTVNFVKQGRKVAITGKITCNANLASGAEIFSFDTATYPEYETSGVDPSAVFYCLAKEVSSDSIINLRFFNSKLEILDTVFNGEEYYFNINYNTLN